MKRLMCLFLAITLVFGLMLTAYAAEEETEAPDATGEETQPDDGLMHMSEAGVDMIKSFEGFSAKPYYDVSQWTVGYGTSCPSDKLDEYKENGITKEAAEELLRTRLKSYENAVRYFSEQQDRPLKQHEFDALVSFTYNLGSGWVYKNSNFRRVIADKNSSAAEIIYWFGAYSSAGGSVLSGLVRRRMAEANLFLNNQYGISRPSNYCYVKLDAQGGSLDSRVNAYDINTSDRVTTTPTRSGYSFLGWYTQSSGGTRVTVLDKSVSGDTLYAHWSGGSDDGEQATDSTVTLEEEVCVTVTNNDVNLRKGPGTNYTTVGSVNKGDKLTVSQTSQNGSLLWGNTQKGWIALKYTDFDEAVKGEATEPEESEPEVEVPIEEPVSGVVTVDSYLAIRKGPGTGYTELGKLYNGDKVLVLEQKSVGSLLWGRIEAGWICLKHVQLGQTELPEEEPADTGIKGTVRVSSSLTIRKGPGTDYGSNGSLKNGASVTITKQQTVGSVTWGYMGKGWISLNFVVLEGQEQEEPEQEPEQTPEQTPEAALTGTVKVSSSLTIRKGPGTDYGSNGSLKNGASVTITKQEKRGTVTWGYMGKGWISMQYVVLKSQSDSTQEKPAETPTGNGGTVSADSGLSIRQGPGTSYAVKGYYSKGDRVEILQTQLVGSVQWGKTARGWISLQFVDMDNDEGGKDLRTVTASCLTVRSAAGTGSRAVDYLYKGTEVEILETAYVSGTPWGRIASGWICLDYAK